MKKIISVFLFTILLSSGLHAAEPVKMKPGQIKISNSSAAMVAASQKQISSKMRALGFKVVSMKNMGGNKWQVKVADWDPGQAQPSYKNALKWDPTIRNPSSKSSSVKWDPMDRAPATKNSSANWDPFDRQTSHGSSANTATVNVEYSAGNLALSKGSLQVLGIVQGNRDMPQGMQMR